MSQSKRAGAARATLPAVFALAAMLAPISASAAALPDRAPIPTARPADMAVAASVIRREVVSISTSEQEIPESRRDVRVVGVNFLPAHDEHIDFSRPVDDDFAFLGLAGEAVMTAVTRLLDGSEGDDIQVAATSGQSTSSLTRATP